MHTCILPTYSINNTTLQHTGSMSKTCNIATQKKKDVLHLLVFHQTCSAFDNL